MTAELFKKLYRFGLPIVCALGWGCLTTGCVENGLISNDPVRSTDIGKSCQTDDPDFKIYFDDLSEEDKAQAVAITELYPDCIQKYDWLSAVSDKAYHRYGAAFYDPQQPWIESRGRRAFHDAVHDNSLRAAACDYLRAHARDWISASWAAEYLDQFEKLAIYSDDIFALLVKVSDGERLQRLPDLATSPYREEILASRWMDFSDELRVSLLNHWVSATWTMQSSGSSQLPQYLTLDWIKRPLPDGVPDFKAALRIQNIRINNREASRRGHALREDVQWQPLETPGLRHQRFNLQPWLNTADNYRVSAKAEITVWPLDVSEDCLQGAESCESQPLATIPVQFDQKYRVFIGFETGAPRRHKEDADNKKTSQAMHLELCNQETCISLWEGKKTDNRDTVEVFQGHDFYLKATLGDSALPVAARLMARQGEGKSWREVSTFFSYAPQNYDVPIRSAIDLADLCSTTGPCKIDLQLRPSLRFARRDPRITRYWGDTLELGSVTLDLQNRTARQIWSDF